MFKISFIAQSAPYNLHKIIFLHNKQNYFEKIWLILTKI